VRTTLETDSCFTLHLPFKAALPVTLGVRSRRLEYLVYSPANYGSQMARFGKPKRNRKMVRSRHADIWGLSRARLTFLAQGFRMQGLSIYQWFKAGKSRWKREKTMRSRRLMTKQDIRHPVLREARNRIDEDDHEVNVCRHPENWIGLYPHCRHNAQTPFSLVIYTSIPCPQHKQDKKQQDAQHTRGQYQQARQPIDNEHDHPITLLYT
jgi:hypothetical protein